MKFNCPGGSEISGGSIENRVCFFGLLLTPNFSCAREANPQRASRDKPDTTPTGKLLMIGF